MLEDLRVIYYMNRLKEKNHMFVLLGLETFNKAQNLFTIRKIPTHVLGD